MKRWKINKKDWWGGLFLTLILLASALSFVQAQTELEVGIPGQVAGGDTVSGPVEYIRFVYLFVLSFVGIAGFVTLVIWGTVWVASSIIDQKARAMEGIRNALIGIGLAFSAYLILAMINQDLTVIRLPRTSQVNITPAPPPPMAATACPFTVGTVLPTTCTQQSDIILSGYGARCAFVVLGSCDSATRSLGSRFVIRPREDCASLGDVTLSCTVTCCSNSSSISR